MLIGYARVSTHDQTLNLQLDSLKQAGCEKLFTDHISGTKAERPGLADAMSHLRVGDSLVVWRLDRLGRSLRHLIDTITGLEAQGIGFKSLQENIDTITSSGKLPEHGEKSGAGQRHSVRGRRRWRHACMRTSTIVCRRSVKHSGSQE